MRTGDFLSAQAATISANTLEKRIVLEQYVRLLYEELTANADAQKHLNSIDRGLLYDLKNVLLRYDQPTKWRDFAKATRQRKENNDTLARNLKAWVSWFESLTGEGNQYPLKKALEKTRSRIEAKLKNRDEEEMAKQWTPFLNQLEGDLSVAAVREWLSLSIRRVIDERSIRQPDDTGEAAA